MFFLPMQHKDAGLSFNPLKAIVSPRPIGWISSKGADGSINLAPYSFFNAISENPAMVIFSAESADADHRKDSLRNIEETGEFVVNIVGQAQFDAMNISSQSFDYGDNEFLHAGLDMVDSGTVSPPRVGNVPAALECRLFQTIPLPRNEDGRGYVLVMGTVTGIYVDDAVVVDGKVDYTAYTPISRLGYRDYGRVTDIFQVARPDDK
jgi:flavin reductase (DIM6/NTAB) family NADH-FMN oxidoreductase RutF